MYFADQEHKDFYYNKIKQAIKKDTYINSLVYLLSSTRETRLNFDKIYNLKKNEINIRILSEPWQTGTSLNICRLAFNLYGNLVSDNLEDISYLYTVSEIMKNIDILIATEAIKIRFIKDFTLK